MCSDENLPQMINSLKTVISLDFDTLFCSHGGVFIKGKEALSGKLSNILELCSKVKILHKRGLSPEQITIELLGKEDIIALLSKGNLSCLNLIKQAILFNQSDYE